MVAVRFASDIKETLPFFETGYAGRDVGMEAVADRSIYWPSFLIRLIDEIRCVWFFLQGMAVSASELDVLSP